MPRIPGGEPLAIECRHFIDCVLDDKPVRSDGASGLQVVRILEAGQKSLENNGKVIRMVEF
jgi:predicted dehydrogenase